MKQTITEGKRNSGHYVKIYTGLLEGKHLKNIGDAIWLLEDLINKTTLEESYDGVVNGVVLRGKPLSDIELSKYWDVHRHTIAKWRERLVKGGYITVKRTKYGYVYHVLKSKKFNNVDVHVQDTNVGVQDTNVPNEDILYRYNSDIKGYNPASANKEASEARSKKPRSLNINEKREARIPSPVNSTTTAPSTKDNGDWSNIFVARHGRLPSTMELKEFIAQNQTETAVAI